MNKPLCVLKTMGNVWAWGLLSIAYFVEICIITFGIGDLLEFKGYPGTGLSLAFYFMYTSIILFVDAVDNRRYSDKYSAWINAALPKITIGWIILFALLLINTLLAITGHTYPLISLWIQISICIGVFLIGSLFYALDECYE